MKVFLILLLAVPTFAQITERYDKFKDTTIVQFNDGYIHGKAPNVRTIKFYAYYTFKSGEERHYRIMFSPLCRLLCFDQYRNLIFMADGERIEFGRGDYVVDRTRTDLNERIVFQTTKEELDKIASGKLVSFQLGRFEAELKEKQRQGIKELLTK